MTSDFADKKLLEGCQTLSLEAVRGALAQGADPNAQDKFGCPASIRCMLMPVSPPDKNGLDRRIEILNTLFGAGADPNASWKEKRGDYAQSGLEVAISLFGFPGKRFGWDLSNGLEVVEAWLKAGANPDPQIIGKRANRPMINNILIMMHETIDGYGGRELAREADNIKAAKNCLVLLSTYGCPITYERLQNIEFSVADRIQIMARVDQADMKIATDPATEASGGRSAQAPRF